jgi:CRP-like cAMP-binding protein
MGGFRHCWRSTRKIRQNISKILASRLLEIEERFREFATEKVATRLRLTLLRLVKRIRKPTYEGIEVSLSREELAQMTGTTLFTVGRLLSKRAEKRFVTLRREAVVIADPKPLKSVSNEDE